MKIMRKNICLCIIALFVIVICIINIPILTAKVESNDKNVFTTEKSIEEKSRELQVKK